MSVLLLLTAVGVITGLYYWINSIIADKKSTPFSIKIKVIILLGIGAAIIFGIFLLYREDVRNSCKEKYPSNVDSYIRCVHEEN